MLEQTRQININRPGREIVVMKFGGSSVASAERIRHAANIVESYSGISNVAVVVSAMQGVTDRLYDIHRSITDRDHHKTEVAVRDLARDHAQTAKQLNPDQRALLPLRRALRQFRREIARYSKAECLDLADRDHIVRSGEALSPHLLTLAINTQGGASQVVEAAQVMVTNNDYGNAKADLAATRERAIVHFGAMFQQQRVGVMGGFYGTSTEGRIAILGRGGSDYTAAVLSSVLDADRLILWKEVDGIFTSDPKTDPDAKFLSHLSYDLAEAMARQGAKILHPGSIVPLRVKNIPIEVRNYFNPEAAGSLVGNTS